MRNFLRQFLALILAGMIIASGIIYLYFEFNNNNPVNNRNIFHVPDNQELNLAAGVYTVFYEYDTDNVDLGPVHLSKSEKMNGVSTLVNLRIINSSDSSEIPITANISNSYTINNSKGESLYRFKINQPARYTITTQFRNADSKVPLTLTIIRNFDEIINGAFKVMGMVILIALPFLLIGWYCYVKEERRKQKTVV